MRTPGGFLAVSLIWLGTAIAPAAEPSPGGEAAASPAAAATENVSAADLKKLSDGIVGLHARFTSTTEALAKATEDLGAVRRRLDETPAAGVDRETFTQAIKDLLGRLQAVGDNRAVLKDLAETQEKRLEAEATRAKATSAALQEVRERIEKLDASLANLASAATSRSAAPATGTGAAGASRFVLPLLVAGVLVLAGLTLYTSAAHRRELQVVVGRLATLSTAPARAAAPAPAPNDDTPDRVQAALVQWGQAQAGRDKLISARVAELSDQVRQLANRPQAPDPIPLPPVAPDDTHEKVQASLAEWGHAQAGRDEAIASKVAELSEQFRQLAERMSTPAPALMTPPSVPNPSSPPVAPAPAGSTTDVLWPEAWREPGSALDRWRTRIESHLESRDHPALPVLAALLSLRVLASRPHPTVPEIAGGVNVLAIALHDYWSSLPDLTAEEVQPASADWIRGVRTIIGGTGHKLEVRDVMVGARFDSDTMQTVQEGPGNHLNVAAAFSWLLLDRSGERARVIHRARVATT